MQYENGGTWQTNALVSGSLDRVKGLGHDWRVVPRTLGRGSIESVACYAISPAPHATVSGPMHPPRFQPGLAFLIQSAAETFLKLLPLQIPALASRASVAGAANATTAVPSHIRDVVPIMVPGMLRGITVPSKNQTLSSGCNETKYIRKPISLLCGAMTRIIGA